MIKEIYVIALLIFHALLLFLYTVYSINRSSYKRSEIDEEFKEYLAAEIKGKDEKRGYNREVMNYFLNEEFMFKRDKEKTFEESAYKSHFFFFVTWIMSFVFFIIVFSS